MDGSPRAELPAMLVERAGRGDRLVQSELLRRYAGPLRALVRRLKSDEDADELTQMLLHHVLVSLPKFNPHGVASLTTWVFAVAHHRLIDEHRKRKPMHLALSAAEHIADSRVEGVQAIEATQQRAALDRAIAALPEELGRAVVLVHLQERPINEVAEIEAVPVGTVKSRLFRARALLAQRLSPVLKQGGE